MTSSMLMTGSSMRCTTEFSIELNDQDLADLPDTVEILKIDDLASVVAPTSAISPVAANYEMVEIELTPEEMDEMLTGSYSPASH